MSMRITNFWIKINIRISLVEIQSGLNIIFAKKIVKYVNSTLNTPMLNNIFLVVFADVLRTRLF